MHFGCAIDARQVASRFQPASKDGFMRVGRRVSSHAAEFGVPWALGEGTGRLKSLSPGGPNGIPVFMYLTDFRENTLRDVITELEPDLFLTVTGLTGTDFHQLVRRKVFNTEQMNQAVFAFRRHEDASLRYTGVDSHQGLTHYGLYNTVMAWD